MINISFDETHHIKDSKPLYDSRYDRVMSFHNDIAPVELNNESFFIDINNNRLFDRVFLKAYGFYENLASVKDKKGWFHIDINGNNAYKERYSWVGNFSENRCTVRDFNNKYFHIDSKGQRVYTESYNYVGDFKYGIAVVIKDNGKSTHIDSKGKEIHGKEFNELNIFHKGYAIAKDEDGYFHIDKKGNSLYREKYKKLEDFYNGCALATTFENTKIVLNESDYSSLQITKPQIDEKKILDDTFSYFKHQILFAILKLDILKNIQLGQEIVLPEISKKLIFRWLLSQKIIDKNYNLTELGKSIENNLKHLILYWQDLPFKTSAYIYESLKAGDEYFSKLHKKNYFEFLEDNSNYLKLSQKINNYYNIDYLSLIKLLNFNDEIVCDIGGGDGRLIKNIKEYYPNIKPMVADKFINKSIDIEMIEITFFKQFKINSDVFILSRILHDWNDNQALNILQNISNVMNQSSLLYIFETIVPENSNSDKGITLSFHLLNFLGGYERTLNDFKELFKKVDLKMVEIFEKDKLISLIKVCKV